MLSDVAGVVASIEGANMIDDCEENVSVVLRQGLICHLFLVVIPAVRDERTHIQHLWKVYPRSDLLVESRRMLKSFEMKAGHNRQLLHCQLFGRLLV